MKLPIIRALVEFEAEDLEKPLESTVAVLEHVSQARGLKDEELDTIGELISNLCGAIEVKQAIEKGENKTQALNQFMQRVLGSIDSV